MRSFAGEVPMAMEEDPLWIVVDEVRRAAARDDLPAVGRILTSVRASRPVPRGPAASVSRPGPDLVGRVPLLAGLSSEEVVRLVDQLELRTLPAGTTVVAEGETGTSVFAIVFGSAEVVRRPEAGGELLAVLGPGDFFGEMALVAKVPRLASVVTTAVTGLVELTAERLAELSKTHPRIEQLLVAHYKDRLLDGLVAMTPLLAALSDAQRRTFVELVGIGAVPPGTVLLEQGQPGPGLHVLLRGRCAVEGRASDGSPLRYPDLHEGDVFGEISLLHGSDATATVTTASPSVVIGLSRRNFETFVEDAPKVRDGLLSLVEERLGRTFDLALETTFRAKVL